MKNRKRFAVISLALAAIIIMAFAATDDPPVKSVHSSSGAPSGYCNDPAGGNRNCTGCHSGSAAEQQAGWITSDIPETGYVPATTYTITAKANGEGSSTFGFQISPQNSLGNILGTLVNTGSETKLTSGTDYVTHTSSGLSGQDSKTWTFDWTAPEAGSGEVVFYGAFNVSNGNGSTSGDQIKLSTLSVNENASTGIRSVDGIERLSAYPNPVHNFLNVRTPADMAGSRFIVYDQSGRQVMEGILDGGTTRLSADHLAAGTYFIKLNGSDVEVIKFVKK